MSKLIKPDSNCFHGFSVEEAKKKMYACSTTTYTGFQAVMTEEESEKFNGSIWWYKIFLQNHRWLMGSSIVMTLISWLKQVYLELSLYSQIPTLIHKTRNMEVFYRKQVGCFVHMFFVNAFNCI